MTDRKELVKKESGSPAINKAKETAMKIHGYDKAEEIARRVKDVSALEVALTKKIEAQREFAREYETLFPLGRNQYGSDSTIRPSADEYCKRFGFTDRTVRRWKECLLEPAKFEAEKQKIIRKCAEIAELWQAANYSSESFEWYTPEKYINAVHEVLGGIDLDPASSHRANKIVKATKYFTIEDDSLEIDWIGKVFLNPPYGKLNGESLASMFCQKAIAEYDLGHIEAGIVLVNSVHSQNWQASLYDFPICFVDHRIQFLSSDGEENKNPTFQNIFVYLGKNKNKFAETFSQFGYVMEKVLIGTTN